MSQEVHIPQNLAELREIAKPLFNAIAGSSVSDTKPMVKPIYQLWQATQDGKISSPEVATCLTDLDNFVARVSPQTRLNEGELIERIGESVNNFLGMQPEREAITTHYKKGRFASQSSPPKNLDEWTIVEDCDHLAVYARKEVVKEASTLPALSPYNDVFHATTTASLPEISQHKSIESSKKVVQRGGKLKSGEVKGRRFVHEHVFASPNKPELSYGLPSWFGEAPVAFGINLPKQEATLAAQGKKHGQYDRGDGYQIGDTVPLENVDMVIAHHHDLPAVRNWVKENLPGVPLVSKEAFDLKYGR